MQVYILMLDFGYDGEMLLGCFRDSEAAKEAAYKYMATQSTSEDFSLYTVDIDPESVGDYLGDDKEMFTITPATVVEHYK